MREWFNRLIDWFQRDSLEAELRNEIRFHQSSLEFTDDAGARLALFEATRMR